MINNKLCVASDFNEDFYAEICELIKETPRKHRKQWEFVYITKALEERGMLKEGKRGLGFAVGNEPLPAFFASKGCFITASDINIEEGVEKGWANTNQLCYGLDSLNNRNICEDSLFRKNVEYREVDMNNIPKDLLKGNYDFTWSSCSMEHLGSISKGLDFLYNQMACLKKGGIAVHTTEFNIASNSDTVDNQNTVLFRMKDIEAIKSKLIAKGYKFNSIDYSIGSETEDWYVDMAPYKAEPHLRLLLEGYVTTSIILIIQK